MQLLVFDSNDLNYLTVCKQLRYLKPFTFGQKNEL